MPSRVLTVMFTDIKGFTERTSKSSRIELRNILKEHEELLMPVVPDFAGRLVKTVGDSFMVVFESPTNAVLCGVMMQERLHERNESVPEAERLEVRVAINTGEVVEREGDVFGEAVNIAARIEGITEASEIYFTEGVYLAMNKAEVPSSEVGVRRLRGVPEAIRVYRVIQDRHSEQYRQLVERLRSGVFADVSIPSAGGVPARPGRHGRAQKAAVAGGAALLVAAFVILLVLLVAGRTAPPDGSAGEKPEPTRPAPEEAPDPVAQAAEAVDEAVRAGEHGLALARAEAMLREHPARRESHEAFGAAVEAEVGALVGKGKFPEALALVEEREGSQDYVRFAGLTKQVRLGFGADSARRGDYRAARGVYGSLVRDYSADLEVLRAVLENTGPGSKVGLKGLAQVAARGIARQTEGELDDRVALMLIESLEDYHAEHESALEAHGLLAERYPAAGEKLRPYLASDERNPRVNAYLFLKKHGLLVPRDELAVHVKNLVKLNATSSYDSRFLEESVGYLEKASAAPDWHERKKALAMGRITRVESLHNSGELAQRVAALLAGAFAPEIRQTVLEWVEGGDYVLRERGFHILKAAGLAGELEVWAYHARNLALEDFSYQYRILHEAVGFFRGQAGGERAREARDLLVQARKAMTEHRETESVYRQKNRLQNLEVNLQAVEEALKAFE